MIKLPKREFLRINYSEARHNRTLIIKNNIVDILQTNVSSYWYAMKTVSCSLPLPLPNL